MTKQLRDVPKIIQEADAEKPSTLAPELPSQGLTQLDASSSSVIALQKTVELQQKQITQLVAQVKADSKDQKSVNE